MLFLDEESLVVTVGTRLLRHLGYTADGFAHAEAAFTALRAAPTAFDLVIADSCIRGMRGLDVAHAIQAIRPGLPVALSCSLALSATPAQLEAAGIWGVLQKPFGLTQMTALLASCTPP